MSKWSSEILNLNELKSDLETGISNIKRNYLSAISDIYKKGNLKSKILNVENSIEELIDLINELCKKCKKIELSGFLKSDIVDKLDDFADKMNNIAKQTEPDVKDILEVIDNILSYFSNFHKVSEDPFWNIIKEFEFYKVILMELIKFFQLAKNFVDFKQKN